MAHQCVVASTCGLILVLISLALHIVHAVESSTNDVLHLDAHLRGTAILKASMDPTTSLDSACRGMLMLHMSVPTQPASGVCHAYSLSS